MLSTTPKLVALAAGAALALGVTTGMPTGAEAQQSAQAATAAAEKKIKPVKNKTKNNLKGTADLDDIYLVRVIGKPKSGSYKLDAKNLTTDSHENGSDEIEDPPYLTIRDNFKQVESGNPPDKITVTIEIDREQLLQSLPADKLGSSPAIDSLSASINMRAGENTCVVDCYIHRGKEKCDTICF